MQLKRNALLQAVAATLLEKDCAQNMVQMDSVPRMDVVRVRVAGVSAACIVPNQSALGNGAQLLPMPGEGVTNTAVATRECAR